MTTIQEGKKELKELIRSTGHRMIGNEEELPLQRVIGTISQRLEDAMDVLDSAEAYTAEQITAERKKTVGETVMQILLHPAVPLALTACAMLFGMLTVSLSGAAGQGSQQFWAIRMILVLALLLAYTIFSLIAHKRKKDTKEEIPSAQAGVDLLKAKVTATKLAGTMLGDSRAIAALFSDEKERADNSFENDIIRIYCSLYETRVDHPSLADLNYAITLSEMLLRRMGIREVPYSPDKENLFEVRDEEYHDEMRVPALIREETGELVRKGEYIRNIGRI